MSKKNFHNISPHHSLYIGEYDTSIKFYNTNDTRYVGLSNYEKALYNKLRKYGNFDKIMYTIQKFKECWDWNSFIRNYDNAKGINPYIIRYDLFVDICH
jgi:transposase